MRWLRLLFALLNAKFRKRLGIDETSSKTFHVWLTDIDASIMNHAAMMTVFEAGRIDFMVRTGFFKIARQKKWYFPSTSISVQFFRPLKLFQKATVFTRLLHVTDYHIYTEQKILRNGKEISVCIVKSKVKSGRDNISTEEILKLLNANIPTTGENSLIDLFEKQDESIKSTFWQNKN